MPSCDDPSSSPDPPIVPLPRKGMDGVACSQEGTVRIIASASVSIVHTQLGVALSFDVACAARLGTMAVLSQLSRSHSRQQLRHHVCMCKERADHDVSDPHRPACSCSPTVSSEDGRQTVQTHTHLRPSVSFYVYQVGL